MNTGETNRKASIRSRYRATSRRAPKLLYDTICDDSTLDEYTDGRDMDRQSAINKPLKNAYIKRQQLCDISSKVDSLKQLSARYGYWYELPLSRIWSIP